MNEFGNGLLLGLFWGGVFGIIGMIEVSVSKNELVKNGHAEYECSGKFKLKTLDDICFTSCPSQP